MFEDCVRSLFVFCWFCLFTVRLVFGLLGWGVVWIGAVAVNEVAIAAGLVVPVECQQLLLGTRVLKEPKSNWFRFVGKRPATYLLKNTAFQLFG